MAYSDVAAIQKSSTLAERCMGGVAQEVVAGSIEGDTSDIPGWVSLRMWDYAASPGWADAWASAVIGGMTDPGSNPGVITDSMILSRTQQLLEQYPLPVVTE